MTEGSDDGELNNNQAIKKNWRLCLGFCEYWVGWFYWCEILGDKNKLNGK